MKVYVDEIPKCCKECRFYALQWCHAVEKEKGTMFISYDKSKDKNNLCPLTTTQSLKQQVREEVVEETRAELNKQKLVMKSDFHPREEEAIPWQDIVAILDQVKGESNDN